jgi:hypothetical protein
VRDGDRLTESEANKYGEIAGVVCELAAVQTGFVCVLYGAFDGVVGQARAGVGAAELRRRSYEAHDVEQALGFERFGHADDGAHLVAGGVVGGLG